MSYNPPPRRRRKQRLFAKDIDQLLYLLGDPLYGLEPVANALEEVLVEFLTDLCHNALHHARAHGRSKVKMDDFPFALRNDPLKLARIETIIKQSQRIAKAQQMLDYKNLALTVGKEEKTERVPKVRKPYKKRKRAEEPQPQPQHQRQQQQQQQQPPLPQPPLPLRDDYDDDDEM